MTTALIFAGGIGERMNSRAKPKQFLNIYGKPIIIHTIEYFERHAGIDCIVVACLESWIDELEYMLAATNVKKVTQIVPGGDTGHDSIYNGLKAMSETARDDDIVLIHDGVRPLISDELITENLNTVKEHGSAITISKADESLGEVAAGKIVKIANKYKMVIIRAPQTFYFKDIWAAHQKANDDNYKSVDSADIMKRYGDIELFAVEGTAYNLKLTSPSDYYIYRAIYEARESLQIFGL